MDMVRTFYSVDMRFFGDDLAHVERVTWYRAAPDALAFPYSTPFCSRTWEQDEGDTPLGEVFASRRYYSGDPPVFPAGRWFCGTSQQWQNGCSSGDKIPEINVRTGLPCCCGDGPFLPEGAIVMGGPGQGGFLQQENLDFVLQENGSRIIIT